MARISPASGVALWLNNCQAHLSFGNMKGYDECHVDPKQCLKSKLMNTFNTIVANTAPGDESGPKCEQMKKELLHCLCVDDARDDFLNALSTIQKDRFKDFVTRCSSTHSISVEVKDIWDLPDTCDPRIEEDPCADADVPGVSAIIAEQANYQNCADAKGKLRGCLCYEGVKFDIFTHPIRPEFQSWANQCRARGVPLQILGQGTCRITETGTPVPPGPPGPNPTTPRPGRRPDTRPGPGKPGTRPTRTE